MQNVSTDYVLVKLIISQMHWAQTLKLHSKTNYQFAVKNFLSNWPQRISRQQQERPKFSKRWNSRNWEDSLAGPEREPEEHFKIIKDGGEYQPSFSLNCFFYISPTGDVIGTIPNHGIHEMCNCATMLCVMNAQCCNCAENGA